MKDGIIEVDSVFGKQLGFTSDKFDGYLWERGNCIYITVIKSKQEGQGNLSKLFEAIHERGYNIKVPTPFARMKSVLIKKGFKKSTELVIGGELEVWIDNGSTTGNEQNTRKSNQRGL